MGCNGGSRTVRRSGEIIQDIPPRNNLSNNLSNGNDDQGQQPAQPPDHASRIAPDHVSRLAAGNRTRLHDYFESKRTNALRKQVYRGTREIHVRLRNNSDTVPVETDGKSNFDVCIQTRLASNVEPF